MNTQEKQDTKNDLLKIFLANQERKTHEIDSAVLSLAPCGSPLDRVVKAFQNNTDIPLKLPLISYISLISALMLKNKIKVNVRGDLLNMDFWTICLSNSGAGKSLSFNQIEHCSEKILGVKSEFSEVVSDAAFIQSLEKHNNSLWFGDEFAQILGTIEKGSDGSHQQTKEYLLKTYDGKRIERTSKSSSVVVEQPALTILGVNTVESFLNKISEESFTDGFAQRFGYFIAENEPLRRLENYPHYDINLIRSEISQAFEQIAQVPLHEQYIVTDEAYNEFVKLFKGFLGKYNVSASFYRRIMYRLWKYAAIYHVNALKTNNEIDTQDILCASRLIETQILDLGYLLDKYNFSEIAQKLKKIIDFKNKCLDTGRKFNPTTISQFCRGFKNVAEIRSLLPLIADFEEERTGGSVPLSISKNKEEIAAKDDSFKRLLDLFENEELKKASKKWMRSVQPRKRGRPRKEREITKEMISKANIEGFDLVALG